MNNDNPNYYAIIPAEVRYDPTLPPLAKLLYGEITSLCSKYGECWASNDYFSTLYSKSSRTITRLLSKLKDRGYIKIDLFYKDDSKQVDKRTILICNTYRQNCQEGIDKNVQNPPDKNVQENNTSNTNNTSINIPPIIPQGIRRIEDNKWQLNFNKFWEEYPKKEKKAIAKKWFEKNHPNEETFELILNKLKLFKRTKQWNKNEGEFIPHATTWLNQRRWEDEIDPKDLIETKEDENKRIEQEILRKRGLV